MNGGQVVLFCCVPLFEYLIGVPDICLVFAPFYLNYCFETHSITSHFCPHISKQLHFLAFQANILLNIIAREALSNFPLSLRFLTLLASLVVLGFLLLCAIQHLALSAKFRASVCRFLFSPLSALKNSPPEEFTA